MPLRNIAIAALMSALAGSAAAVEPRISISDSHVLLLKTDGTVWAWGANSSGQLGTGAGTPATGTPVQVPGLTGVVDVIARQDALSMALKADGTVWVWGDVSLGQSTECVACGGQFKEQPFLIPRSQGIIGIGAAYDGFTAFAISADGRAWSWGRSNNAELGNGLFADRAQPQPIPNLTSIVHVTASADSILALRSDGTTFGWGYDDGAFDPMRAGNINPNVRFIPATRLNVPPLSSIEAANINTAGLFVGISGGVPLIWGDTDSNTLTCDQVPAGSAATAPQPYTPRGLTGLAQVAGGQTHILFRTLDGHVFACGANADGEFGDGTTAGTDYNLKQGPVATLGLPTALSSVAAGTFSSAAIDLSGGVYTWGRTAAGQLSGQGDNSSLPASNLEPVKLSINAGPLASAPAVFAGTQAGPAINVTLDAGVAVAPAHRNQPGKIYLAVVTPGGQILISDSSGHFVPYDPTKILPSIYTGMLPAVYPHHVIQNANLGGFVGSGLLIGYGLGSGAAADHDLLTNSRYQRVLTLVP